MIIQVKDYTRTVVKVGRSVGRKDILHTSSFKTALGTHLARPILKPPDDWTSQTFT